MAGTGASECPVTNPYYEEHALTHVNHGDVCRKDTRDSGTDDWSRWECPTHCNKVAGLASPYCTDKKSGAPCRKQFAHIDGKAAWSAGFNKYGSENRKVTTGKNGYGLTYLSIGPMRISTYNSIHLTVASKLTGSTSVIFRAACNGPTGPGSGTGNPVCPVSGPSELNPWHYQDGGCGSTDSRSINVLTTQTEHVLPLGYGRFRGCTLSSDYGNNVQLGANLMSTSLIFSSSFLFLFYLFKFTHIFCEYFFFLCRVCLFFFIPSYSQATVESVSSGARAASQRVLQDSCWRASRVALPMPC